jgi:imidazolonepropionase-like amidohydrolase
LTGGRIFDGTGATVRNGTVVIERNKIKAILPPDSTAWPGDARVIDVAGKTVMPGLIDMHTHITEAMPPIDDGPTVVSNEAINTLHAVERLRFYIENGITSVRDLGSHGDIPFRLKEFLSQNRIPGPRLFPAGQEITGTGGHPTEGMHMNNPLVNAERAVDGPDAWRKAVREQYNKGADLISTTNVFSREEIATAVEEAHALGIKVSVDAGVHSWGSSWATGLYYLEWAVEAGVDVVEHMGARTDETIRLMAEKGIASVPTARHAEAMDQIMAGDTVIELIEKQRRAGIKMGVGTDEGGTDGLPDSYIVQLRYLVEAGYSVPEALVAATKTGAEILDMDDKLGTLEPGKLADITVIDGTPDANLADLANVDLVIRDGYIVVQDGRVFVLPHVSTGVDRGAVGRLPGQ